MSDNVTGADAGFGRRGVVDWRNDLDEAIGLHCDFDAEPTELATSLDLHILEALGIHVARVRIEPIEHAIDCRLDEFALVRLLHIMRADPLEYITEQIELAIGIRLRRPCARADQEPGRRLSHERHCCACHGAQENQRSLAHHPRTFSFTVVAHHGLESTGVPSFRNSIYSTGCGEPIVEDEPAP